MLGLKRAHLDIASRNIYVELATLKFGGGVWEALVRDDDTTLLVPLRVGARFKVALRGLAGGGEGGGWEGGGGWVVSMPAWALEAWHVCGAGGRAENAALDASQLLEVRLELRPELGVLP